MSWNDKNDQPQSQFIDVRNLLQAASILKENGKVDQIDGVEGSKQGIRHILPFISQMEFFPVDFG